MRSAARRFLPEQRLVNIYLEIKLWRAKDQFRAIENIKINN